jgi:hypothetical protein
MAICKAPIEPASLKKDYGSKWRVVKKTEVYKGLPKDSPYLNSLKTGEPVKEECEDEFVIVPKELPDSLDYFINNENVENYFFLVVTLSPWVLFGKGYYHSSVLHLENFV